MGPSIRMQINKAISPDIACGLSTRCLASTLRHLSRAETRHSVSFDSACKLPACDSPAVDLTATNSLPSWQSMSVSPNKRFPLTAAIYHLTTPPSDWHDDCIYWATWTGSSLDPAIFVVLTPICAHTPAPCDQQEARHEACERSSWSWAKLLAIYCWLRRDCGKTFKL